MQKEKTPKMNIFGRADFGPFFYQKNLTVIFELPTKGFPSLIWGLGITTAKSMHTSP
jgi:hypothetical protein